MPQITQPPFPQVTTASAAAVLAAAAAQGRRGGRPVAVDNDTLAIARARQARGESITDIAKHLKVGRSTLYRALTPDNTDQPSPAH